ncbi:AN1-type zinc finger protein 1 [Rhizodiscina lignyota]|uniref:AN1-type zinc finger protein 1 n=1 Tax=Rhizodiscina lignyota TaxID=1504668 RepID=A0A9P4M8M0_9PEZI|nr:AN1-type zinc finger protein 1 [Rhizodiscina lignyota]
MANNNSLNPNDASAQSYTSMSVGDVESIGAHCQMAFCHQLDFLPFRCESCKGTFCLDHRTETAHSCAKAGEWARRRTGVSPSPSRSSTPSGKPSVFTYDKQCSSPSCKTLVDTATNPGVHCANCNRTYCLKHRMGEDHDCKNLTPLGARPGAVTSREKGMAALEKLRAWGANKKAAAAKTSSPLAGLKKITSYSSSNSSASSSLAAMNALKRSAKGDDKIPPEKRVYLHVEASADTTTAKYPTGKFFYSKEWSIGRVLDAAAKALQVANVNNRVEGEDERLRVFHVEAGRLLEFKEKVGDALKDGNTIVLLRGVGPAVPDLIEA